MPRSRPSLFVFVAAAALPFATAFAACIPSYTFGGVGGGGGIDDTPDGGSPAPDGPAPGEGGSPPPPSADSGGDAGPATVVSSGSTSAALGYGYQTHLVYAQHDQRFWLFYADDTRSVIETIASPDLVHWTRGNSIVLSGSYLLATDGSSFSVAYADLGGQDVVHLVVNGASPGPEYLAFHVRATIANGGILASSPVALPDSTNGSICQQDGPTTTVTADGKVYDVTAWTNRPTQGTTCDTNVYLAPSLDTGTTWDSGAFGFAGYYNSYVYYGFAHELLTVPDGGPAMLLYPDQDSDDPHFTQFATIGWAVAPFTGDGPDSGVVSGEQEGDELFANEGKFASLNDWAACALQPTDVHVIRHVLTAVTEDTVASFEEEIFNGTSWQYSSTGPAATTSTTNSGLVLISGADPARGMLLVTILSDSQAINVVKWTPTGGWVQAGSIPSAGNVRQSLVGSGCGATRPIVLWTETAGNAQVIKVADLSALL